MSTLTYHQVRNKYLNVTDKHIELETNSTKAHLNVIMDMLGLAAVNGQALNTRMVKKPRIRRN